ncbi:protein-arginine deiminase type-4-like [Ornithorhynchus anatinus]|uniref:Protein-arginine deiminase n=1 Tax=Ornithorhynchus anatinus TaxID=9258 RepID=F6RL45_ORNAN|nr:protein-arginine deiminase type-4-like [Ornithorhynchus anatinus]
MSLQRFARVSVEQPTHAICVVGTKLEVDVFSCAPKGCTSFDVNGSAGVVVKTSPNLKGSRRPTSSSKWPLDGKAQVVVMMNAPSSSIDDQKVRISYYGSKEGPALGKAVLYLTGIQISLVADTNRSGKLGKSKAESDKKNWTWGPRGHGAVLLVNCDRDGPQTKGTDKDDNKVLNKEDLKDMSLMILRTRGPGDFFVQHQLILHTPKKDSDKVRVFLASGDDSLAQYEMVLGPRKASRVLEPVNGQQDRTFYIEGLAFPDADFSGLVSFSVTLLGRAHQDVPEVPIFEDTVVFRVAPWIMTPNTLAPQEVYVCRMEDNKEFVEAVATLAKKAKCKLTICPEAVNRNDQWIQDEIEIGYIQAPHKTMPVIFDSPRNRGLRDFSLKHVVGPDFGYVTREPKDGIVSNLDTFGNLDVSPPVTVRGKEYPLGRIIFGNSIFSRPKGTELIKVLRSFLYAQTVQAPVELFSGWLLVGHVDEFVSFVPAQDRKGFRLLLASPSSCFQLLREKQEEGYGSAALFEGISEYLLSLIGKKKMTIDDILSDETLSQHNDYVESCINWNRGVLKWELGLDEEDIIDIPQLFKLQKVPSPGDLTQVTSKAEALFPDLVNMVVLGKYLGIPKPFGPIVNGHCCLEEKVRSLLEPLGLDCTFIDDFSTYHVENGEVHCGTNVRRKPFSFKWWNMVP